MIPIYLCDDDAAVRSQIQTVLEQKICIEGLDMMVVCSVGSAKSLLSKMEQEGGKGGLYVLDVELNDESWDGFLLGREIRKADPRAILVYITNYGDLAYRTFQYHLEAFDYIVKDPRRLQSSVSACLEAIQMRLEAERQEPADVFTLRTGDRVRYVPIKDILFFETSAISHHVLLHTADSRMDFVSSLNEIEAQMGERFIRVHRAYLAAADKIHEVDLKQNKLLVGNRECLISRAGKEKLLKKLGGNL